MKVKSPLFDILSKANVKEAEKILEEYEESQEHQMPETPKLADEISSTMEEPASVSKHDEYRRLFNILNPKTGRRYDIPMVDRNKPGYFFEYVDCMKILERDPDTFKRMMEWN